MREAGHIEQQRGEDKPWSEAEVGRGAGPPRGQSQPRRQQVGTLGGPGGLGAPPCGRSYSKCTRATSSLPPPPPPSPGEA